MRSLLLIRVGNLNPDRPCEHNEMGAYETKRRAPFMGRFFGTEAFTIVDFERGDCALTSHVRG